MERLPTLENDGLSAPEVGEWGEEKYQLVRCYADIFARAMSGKWASIVYLDLYAGAGRATLKDSRRVVASSALLVLATYRHGRQPKRGELHQARE